MVDLGSIQAAIGGLQAAGNIAKSMIGNRDATALQAKTIELQKAILAAQDSALTAKTDQASLIDRIRDLEEEVARSKTWDAEKERYELIQVGDRSTLAYTLKEGVESSEHPHQLCTNCFTDGKKSILQEEVHSVGRAHVLVCHRCRSEIYTRGMRQPEHSGGRRTR